MSLNTEKHRAAIQSAWRDVLNENSSTNWALFGYDGLSNDLKFVSKGDGGLEELVDDLSSGKIMYAFLKVDVPDSSVAKYVLVNWQGEGAPTVRKGTCANHLKDVSSLLSGFHLTLHARTEDDLDTKLLLAKLAKAGSSFNFKTRTEEIAPSGPVGTTYQKVNPGKEINSKERDQFWIKEEQEEKSRQAAERKRREEEKKRVEEEVRKRDAVEAARRDSAQDNKKSPTESWRDTGGAALRQQRSAEAERLIGVSTATARAVFQQNLAQGQINTKSHVPEKPIRSSVIAQRINSLQQQSQKPPTAPTPPTLKPQEPEKPKTSPIRNIDKIAMSLESPSQIQYEPIFDPMADLSPSAESESDSFSLVTYEPENSAEEMENHTNETDHSTKETENHVDVEKKETKQSEAMIKQNILENDMFDASYSSSSNENEDDDSDNKFSTIKRSPYSKNNISEGLNDRELSRQNTVIENVNYKKEHTNGNGTLEDVSPEGMEDDSIYQDLHEDPGLTARALYDYQAADNTEISFDPGDVITHIDQIDEGWWQGLGPHGDFGLFPANYVELLPAKAH